MKKALIVLLVLAVAGGAFAQGFTLQSRMDVIWVPLQVIDDGNATVAGMGMGRDNIGGQGPRARLFGSAVNAENTLGLQIQLQFFANAAVTGFSAGLGLDDNVNVWWRPIDWFTIRLGRYVVDPLMGNLWDFWFRRFTVGSYTASVHLFNRWQSDNIGALLTFTPGDLIIGVNFRDLYIFGSGANEAVVGDIPFWNSLRGSQSSIVIDYSDGRSEFVRVLQRAQVSVGYRIPDIGLVRFQYVGWNPAWGALTRDADGAITGVNQNMIFNSLRGPSFEAAFRFTGVAGLNLDLGYKVYLPMDETWFTAWNRNPARRNRFDHLNAAGESFVPRGTYMPPMSLTLGAIYTAGDFEFRGFLNTAFAGKIDLYDGPTFTMGPEINFHIWPSYNLGFMRLGLDFGFMWKGDGRLERPGRPTVDIENGIMVGFGIWAERAFSTGSGTNATIRGGLAYTPRTTTGAVYDADWNRLRDRKHHGVFSIPIMFDFVF